MVQCQLWVNAEEMTSKLEDVCALENW